MDHHGKIAQELKRYPWFANFADEMLLRFAEHAKLKSYSPGSTLLSQGEESQALFVIRSGRVQILVDSECVAELSQPGEILGEMGLISGMESSATVVALDEVDCIIIESENIREIQKDERFHLLYRTFAGILAARIRTTNLKAKKFEEANRELKKAQKELETINKILEKAGAEKADDLSQTLARTLERVVGSADELAQVQNFLAQFSAGGKSSGLQDALQALESVKDRLKPLDQLYNSEVLIKNSKVVFIDSSRKQQVVAKMALGGTGVDLRIGSKAEELHSVEYDLLFCEVSQISELTSLHQRNPRAKIVVMTPLEIPQWLDDLRKLDFVDHLVSVDPEDKTFTVRNIVSTVTKVLSNQIFGLEKYLSFGADIQKHKVVSSAHRKELTNEMLVYFKDLGVRRSILDNIQVVAEEMLMNAIYDAPVDSEGQAMYNHLPRSASIELSPHERPTLCYGTDGILIGVSVADPFGALGSDTLLKYLHSCYAGVAGSMNQQKGGAGRGLHQILEGSDLCIFNVNRHKKTEAIGLFHINSNEGKKDISSLHYFFVGDRKSTTSA